MNQKNPSQELEDREIDVMLGYVPAYTEANAQNIKKKFKQKAREKKRVLPRRKVILVGIAATMLLATTLVYAEVIDLSKLYMLVFGDNASYVEQYIEPLVEPTDITTDSIDDIPVGIQSEYDGLVMRLISALHDENELRIFVTVTDTTGDRLSESLDFASWGLSQGYGGNISVIDYQQQTKTAFLMITSLGDDHEGQVTLTINDFMTGRECLEDLPEEAIHIDQVINEHTAETMTQVSVWKRGGGGDTDRYEQADLLTADELAIPFQNTEKFSISNAGFVDGQFHLQIKTVLGGEELNAGYYINARFVDAKKGVTYEPTASIDFITDKKYAYSEAAKEPHANYTELIYTDITSVEQLQGLSMQIGYMKTPHISQGSWSFAFTVPEKVATAYSVDQELPINGEKIYIEALAISPLGITLTLPTALQTEYKHMDSVYVIYDDGRKKMLDQSASYTYEGTATLVFGGQVIELEGIQSILFNGVNLEVN